MPQIQDFKELLKRNGLKVTTQRVAVLEALQNRPEEHLTVEEIYGLVKSEHPEIGLATVYRTVQLLCEFHFIDKLILDDGFVRYEIGKKENTGHHHHHLICKNCGKVFSFEDDLLEDLEDTILRTMNFQVIDHEVKMFGLCSSCQKNK